MSPHPKRTPSLDVDIHTLYEMRDQGMSNQEIAASLGVSIGTIYKYIGKQGKWMKGTAVHAETASPFSTLFTEAKCLTRLEGKYHFYMVDQVEKTVSVEPKPNTTTLDALALNYLIEELRGVRTVLKS